MIIFPETVDEAGMFVACLKNAFSEMYPLGIEDELQDDNIGHIGMMLQVKKREFNDDAEKEEWLEHVEGLVFPVPVNKNIDTSAYLFTPLVGLNTNDSCYAIGSAVFSTGSTERKELPPNWAIASTIHYGE